MLYNFFFNIFIRIRFKRIKIGHNVRITKNSFFEGYNNLGDRSIVSGSIGFASYIGNDSLIVGKVGKYCSIAPHVTFLASTHPTRKWVSTHPCFYSKRKLVGFTFADSDLFDEHPKVTGESESIIVGNDVYIGYGATIVGPVKIGDGAIIGANSVVTRDVEPFDIVAGVPAKTIRKRFTDAQIEKLLKIKWWDKKLDWIKKHSNMFSDVDCFLSSSSEAGK